MELFAKIIDGLQPLTIFVKNSILDCHRVLNASLVNIFNFSDVEISSFVKTFEIPVGLQKKRFIQKQNNISLISTNTSCDYFARFYNLILLYLQLLIRPHYILVGHRLLYEVVL